MREAVVKGEARDVAVRVKGDLRHIASSKAPPGSEFRFAGQVHGVTLAYVPPSLQPAGQVPWPALENLSGEPRVVKVVPYLEWVLNRPEADRNHTQYNRLFAEIEYEDSDDDPR